MRKILRLSLALFSLSLLLPLFPVSGKAQATVSKLMITEVKLGGGDDVVFSDGGKAKDFVTLYNQSSQTINLDGWILEYAKAGNGFADCAAQLAGASTTQLNGMLLPGAASSPIKRSMNDTTDGALRIIDGNDLVHDLVGWGATNKCFDNSSAMQPGQGKSLQRNIDCETITPIDTDNNAADFVVSGTPGPGQLSGPLTDDCEAEELPDEEEPPAGGQSADEEPPGSCEEVIISELLPNPAGSDSGKEFIELHNPTSQAVFIEGCQLSTSANTKVFTFAGQSLSSGQYIAFYQTGLTLANSAGGSVFLLDTDGTELNQVDYPPNIEDDVSWSLIEGNWFETFLLTPGSANGLLTDKPCDLGEMRNAGTGRCVNAVLEAAGLAACKPGQERNPETKRCRNITSLSAVLKACDPGQTRNPETNRCRKADASSLAPCKEGQERNPETNRCRNISNLSSDDLTDVKDVLAATSADKSSWLLAAGSMVMAFGYGIWEWRSEILQQLLGLKEKFSL